MFNMNFPAFFNSLRPAFRLRSLMILVILASLGLAWEVERRRKVERRRLALIADGRRTLIGLHENNARDIRKKIARSKEWIKRYEDMKSGLSRQPWISKGREESYWKRLVGEIPGLEAWAAWEDAMTANSIWATEHPAEPWPPRPPEPGKPSSLSSPPVAESPSRAKVPTVVKKNR